MNLKSTSNKINNDMFNPDTFLAVPEFNNDRRLKLNVGLGFLSV